MQASGNETLWKQITLFLLTVAIVVVCVLMLHPFLSALVGAVVLAVISQRPYRWLASKIRNKNACATLAVVLIVVIIVTPIYILAQQLTEQAVNVISSLRSDAMQVKLTAYFDRHPSLATRINAVTDSIDIQHTAQATAAFLGAKFAGLLGRSFSAITEIVVMLFILFFLYRDRDLAISFVRSLLPLKPAESDHLISRVGDTIYATALGRLAIAGVQGLLAGLSYWVLGVPNHLFWAILTCVMAMIPAFGAFLVWMPIALYLGFNGHWGNAALLAIWGGGVVSLIDNILYPVLIGPRLRQHTVAVLLSILGGIALFGITGIVLGPVIFTVASVLLEIWQTRSSPSTSII